MCGMKLEVMLSLTCEQYLEFHPVNIYWDAIYDLNDSSNNQGEMYPEGAKKTQWQMWKIKHKHSRKGSLQKVWASLRAFSWEWLIQGCPADCGQCQYQEGDPGLFIRKEDEKTERTKSVSSIPHGLFFLPASRLLLTSTSNFPSRWTGTSKPLSPSFPQRAFRHGVYHTGSKNLG